MTDEIHCVVIGAGVIGLAVARTLALTGREVLIVERERKFGLGISARNSEVIHAGIYSQPGSLKARLCVAGRDLLYEYCRQRGIDNRRCGKLIVATDDSHAGKAEALRLNAIANGVDDLAWLSAVEVKRLEPELFSAGALLSPSTGLIDSHAFMLALLGEAEAHGATIAYGTELSCLNAGRDGVALTFGADSAPTLTARLVVNCAGLNSVAIAQMIAGFPKQFIPRLYYSKGSYFTLSGRSPASRLIYPMPEPGGLGIHLTLDLAGQARFGPDVEWVDAPDYDVVPGRVEKFATAIRAYWPGLDEGRLSPGYAGVRPKIVGPGEPTADFRIEGPATHGVRGIVNLFGIESPGLTASLAIAEEVVRLAETDAII
ncbi:MAG: FAD-dependent oxidoreductase [Rhodospirillales bacterium]|nr:FAD-dependent oxidoreductase [Rhodospirillales bacterium]